MTVNFVFPQFAPIRFLAGTLVSVALAMTPPLSLAQESEPAVQEQAAGSAAESEITESAADSTNSAGETTDSVAETKDDADHTDHLHEIELTEEQQQDLDAFKAANAKLAIMMSDLRDINLRFHNGGASVTELKKEYRELRNQVRTQLTDTYNAALQVLRTNPEVEAATYVLTWGQHCFENGIYDETIFEGSTRLLDGDIHQPFLYLAAARSAVVTGHFDTAKQLYETLKEEYYQKCDHPIIHHLDQLKANWEREQKFLEQDAKNENLPRVKFKTTRGDFVVELFLEQAPNTVANFVKLVNEGFYDGLDFYQVIENLLALCGDNSGNGTGNAGQFIKDEHELENARPPMRGSLLMAKMPMPQGGKFVPNSASSQFSILFLPLATDLQQTVFGRVIEGMDVVSSLRRVDPAAENDKSDIKLPPDRIFSAEVIRGGQSLPEPQYVPLGGEQPQGGEKP